MISCLQTSHAAGLLPDSVKVCIICCAFCLVHPVAQQLQHVTPRTSEEDTSPQIITHASGQIVHAHPSLLLISGNDGIPDMPANGRCLHFTSFEKIYVYLVLQQQLESTLTGVQSTLHTGSTVSDGQNDSVSLTCFTDEVKYLLFF